jgi:hypothetical protein
MTQSSSLQKLPRRIAALVILVSTITMFRTLATLTNTAKNDDPEIDNRPIPMYQPSTLPRNNHPDRPKLRNILKVPTMEIIGDPQFLLDFAIVGFPKCGTTALQEYLSQHVQVEMLRGEAFCLMNREPQRLIHRLYLQLPKDATVKRGYKNPLDIRAPPSLHYLTQHFPNTTLVIGIRHPVLWFESLYNFKVQNLPKNVNPGMWGNANDLVGACADWNDTHCVGTAKGWFHVHLATLGKVPFPQEWKKEYPLYLANHDKDTPPSVVVPNPVFLYESQQLVFDDDALDHNARQFRTDLQQLLGLNESLPKGMPRTKPDMEHFGKRLQKKKDQHKIKICDAQYQILRDELMSVARKTSVWIRNDFLKSPTVQVSSPDYFRKLLEGWMVDPCESKSLPKSENATSKD